MILKLLVVAIIVFISLQSSYCLKKDYKDSDKYVLHCPSWAKNGECTKSLKFMKKHCKKSCNECPSKKFVVFHSVAMKFKFLSHVLLDFIYILFWNQAIKKLNAMIQQNITRLAQNGKNMATVQKVLDLWTNTAKNPVIIVEGKVNHILNISLYIP